MNRIGLHLAFVAVTALGLAAIASAQTQLPVPVETSPVPPVPSDVPAAPAAPAVRALTVPEFAGADFRAGRYSLFVVHPCTNRPVKVCFSLPVCPRRVRTTSNSVELRWGVLPCKRVVILFLPDGTVSVRG